MQIKNFARKNVEIYMKKIHANFFARITYAARFVVNKCENFGIKFLSNSSDCYVRHIWLYTSENYL